MNFKKCKKAAFFEGAKKSFFVMGKRGRFSAKPMEEKEFGFRVENLRLALYLLAFYRVQQNCGERGAGAEFGKS